MKKIRTQNGITLVALIITIIVLLILSVVAIASVQDSGIIAHATNASTKYKEGEEKERIKLAYSNYKISKYKPMEKTAEQEELETFFLGENKQGKSAMTLINTDKSTQDTFIVDYKDEEIKINLSEAIFNSDTNEIYLCFDYNGYRYKLTVENTNEAMTKKIEAIESKLKVEGAEVKGNEGWAIKFSNTGNIYILTNDGKITQLKEEALLLEKYILGQDLAGRPMTDIMETGTARFIDDKTTEGINEAEIIGAKLIDSLQEIDEVHIVYFESQGITYKFRVDLNTGIIDGNYGVVKVYDPGEGTRVGKTVKYDNKIWTIIYDDSTNGLQMLSNQNFLYNDAWFYIGHEDSLITDWDSLITVADLDNNGTLTNFEKSVYSYNNAIDTLNTVCENLLKDDKGKYKNENIIDVRCVGSNPIDKSSENETLTGIGNKRCKSTDLNYVSDLERMIALGIKYGYDSEGISRDYWFASRLVDVYSDEVCFRMRRIGSIGPYGWYYICRVFENNNAITGNDSRMLRPVISLNPTTNLVADSTGEADYTF